MTFPLTYRQVIRGCAGHKAAGLGCAVDYVANYVPLYAPVSGLLTRFNEAKGGNWLWLHGDDGRQYQFAHLSQRNGDGKVAEGQQIGITGNSGTESTGPHLHVQVFVNGLRIDPEPLFATVPLANQPLPSLPPIGGDMNEKQWIDLALPSALTYWEAHHPGASENIDSIINDLRGIYNGGDAGVLYKQWQQGK